VTRRIHVLPDSVANQIAAGEVVERPASVVKELVENALDAGAERVVVEVEAGGKRRIRVSDDGVGMGREDAVLALDRHATSKITRAEDLHGVASFGFRGEALPSIAAVSRFVMETREGGDAVGTRVRANAGRILDVADTARRPGTTVEVRGLFFNAPARARFLKSAGAETRAVSEALTTLALANPAVGITLHSGDRTLMELAPAGDLRERVAGLWGEEGAGTLIPVRLPLGGMEVEGLVQRPDEAQRGVRRAQLLVNGRPFRDAALLQAAERGYRTTIPDGVRPWIFLRLTVPGDFVDVNVHPAKAEVRFRRRAAVEELVEAGVRAAMADVRSSARLGRERVAGPGAGGPGVHAGRSGVGAPGTDRVREPRPPAPDDGGDQMALFLAGGAGGADGAGGEPGDAAVGRDADAASPDPPELPMERPSLHQIHRTWILAESRDGLLIVDQHSAHERVLFERLMNAYAEGGAEAQRLLFPLTVKLTPQELREVEEVEGLLARAGFEVEAFGNDTVIVHTVPNPHPWFDAERCFREMVAELTAGTSDLMRSARNQHERIAMTFACKGAIKAGQVLGQREMQELFEALFATELPWHDVHGRPTVVRLSVAELERKFGR
jgi:DNA mismatch repair protein MutL